MNDTVKSISKVLSPNDIGSTGAHQAGILVPKNKSILSFFPRLNSEEKNPRIILSFIDDSNQKWQFSFIYYNNRLFGGTRNEYRLTRMTKYINSNNLKAGDEIVLTYNADRSRRITHIRKQKNESSSKLKLSGLWKVIQF